ncbi:hypothetical protein MVG78_18610 [Roseomonas gilardii subsp. gilardii]|uniref:hypothetical protein n=1 Tax=Roseomonas gilardii TaxID=257708 RepID=UPI001FF8B57D|nr:hypothetical protein [Roseomonas gilardii]UPG72468.1 hypothetical protein MVG78_18610 [Roseomonas gilardii subsp. gilardii]
MTEHGIWPNSFLAALARDTRRGIPTPPARHPAGTAQPGLPPAGTGNGHPPAESASSNPPANQMAAQRNPPG